MIGLVDANNFYANCERVFRPDLIKKPVVVLSNNDGCVIAQSAEAKALGVEMGKPAFKCKTLFRKYKITVFSANFELYGELSQRLIHLYSTCFQDVDVYSIDEAFIKTDSTDPVRLKQIGYELHHKAFQWIGIPVTVGFGPSKTLAKLAHYLAKRMGLPAFVLPTSFSAILDTFPIEHVWGIGRKHAKLLLNKGITTAGLFAKLPTAWVQKHLTIQGVRIQEELKGNPCFTWKPQDRTSKKMILSSRSFGEKLTSLYELEGALTNNCITAAFKLFKSNVVCSGIVVFIYKKTEQKKMSESVYIKLPYPTQSILELLETAFSGLKKLYQPGFFYLKSGIVLTGLSTKTEAQITLFSTEDSRTVLKKQQASTQMMTLNQKFGKQVLIPASLLQGRDKWKMNQNFRSPRYTTQLADIPRLQFI